MTAQRNGSQTLAARAVAPFREFVSTQSSSAVVLACATVAALVWANSPWQDSYHELWDTELSIAVGTHELSLTLREWLNDGLMAFFFFVVGLEIRREFDMGELRERKRLATPVVAALGGALVPALIYLAFNGGTSGARGWGIAMGTDTAFALGLLTIVGRRCPQRLRVFLLTLVIVDDIVALTVIALAYTEEVSVPALLAAAGFYALVLLMRAAHVRNGVPYFVVGVALWVAMLESGVHATIAGVAVGVLATAYPPSRAELHEATARWRLFREQPTPEYARSATQSLRLAVSPNERLQLLFHPWTSYVIVPLFALANAGLELSTDALRDGLTSRITLGIVCGLVLGKPLGIIAATWLGTRSAFGRLPLTIKWPALVGGATVAGIGFTVALLIAHISFEGRQLEEAQLGILGASVIATFFSFVVFQVIERLPASIGGGRLAEPLIDLAEPVDPDRDHIRGPDDAPVTLVEYADFECPYCGQAEPVVREVLRSFGTDVRYVFRHLPLSDVHEHAQLAAEASEAAAAQGKFWEMHDLLFAHSDALELDDLRRYAREIGLDEERFDAAMNDRKYALRVIRDIESADASGVAGTPTFFVNGHRHHGAYDLDALRAAIEREAAIARASRRD